MSHPLAGYEKCTGPVQPTPLGRGQCLLPPRFTRLGSAARCVGDGPRTDRMRDNEPVTMPGPADYQRLGPREYLDRLLAEYKLSDADVIRAVIVRPPPGAGGKPGPVEYLFPSRC